MQGLCGKIAYGELALLSKEVNNAKFVRYHFTYFPYINILQAEASLSKIRIEKKCQTMLYIPAKY